MSALTIVIESTNQNTNIHVRPYYGGRPTKMSFVSRNEQNLQISEKTEMLVFVRLFIKTQEKGASPFN